MSQNHNEKTNELNGIKVNEKQNEKVLAMYRAVCELVDEGMEIEKMKVLDVTTRAGIGKGTAYEYFRSKEELLSRALHYDFEVKFHTLCQQIKEQNSFYDAIICGFDWMEENACNNRLKVQFVKMAELQKCQFTDIGCLKDFPMMEVYNDIMNAMIHLGKKDGVIVENAPEDLIKLDIFSSFMEYFFFMKIRNFVQGMDIQETRKFLIEGMIRHYEA